MSTATRRTPARYGPPAPIPPNPVRRGARSLLASSALQMAAIYASAGAGFALANLILARVLDPAGYGMFALVIAVYNIAIPLAPLGLDGVLLRHDIPRGRTLFRRGVLTSSVVAAGALVIGWRVYALPADVLALLVATIVAGGIGFLSVSHFQSRGRLALGLAQNQGTNVVLFGLALWVAIAGISDIRLPLAGLLVWYVLSTAVVWVLIARGERGRAEPSASTASTQARAETVAYVGVVAVSLLQGQMERLLIPRLLGLEELALFGIVAAMVGSVFRILLLSVGFSLVPALRREPRPAERRRIVVKEARAVGLVVLATSIVLWWLSPWVVTLFVGDKYALTGALILATLAIGWLKVVSAFGRAAVTALATSRELAWFNAIGWVSIAAGVAGAWFGARWGLLGVLYGVAAGWAVLAIAAARYALPHLRGDEVAAPASGETPTLL